MSDANFSFGPPKPPRDEPPADPSPASNADLGFNFGNLDISLNPHLPALSGGDDYAVPPGATGACPPACPTPLSVTKKGWQAIGIGGGLALLPFIFGMNYLKLMMGTFAVLVHEFGHAIFGWLFARPSIPAFDFRHGGGLTSILDRSTALFVCFGLAYAWLLVALRKQPIALALVIVAGGLYSLFAFTTLHDYLISYMGHGTELLFVTIFFYRAFSGSAVAHQLERYAYGFCASAMLFHNVGFAWELMTDQMAVRFYIVGKPGVSSDFVKIARLAAGIEVSTVAFFHFLMSGVAVVVAFLFFRYRSYLLYGLRRTLGMNQLTEYHAGK